MACRTESASVRNTAMTLFCFESKAREMFFINASHSACSWYDSREFVCSSYPSLWFVCKRSQPLSYELHNDKRRTHTNVNEFYSGRQYTKVDVGGCSSMCEGAFSCAITPWNICVKKSHNIYTAKILPRECVTYLSEVFVSRTCSELPKAVRIDQRLMFQNMTLLSWHRSVFQCYNTKSLILVKYIKVHWQMCILVFKINK